MNSAGRTKGAVNNSCRSVSIRTLGCKVNSYESEQILQGLLDSGSWRSASAGVQADLFIINSCTVTREADRQTRQEIRRCIRENPNGMVVVTGCYAQIEAASCADICGVDLVVGNSHKLKIPQLIPRLQEGSLPKILTERDTAGLVGLPDPLLGGFKQRTRAFIQVQQGCDQGCTFCIIHVARGVSRSLPAGSILRQIQRLHRAGFEEMVLCGVDLGAYGADSGSETAGSLLELLLQILKIPGDFRIRLGSLDPFHICDELLTLIASEPRLCPHLHISLQSGNTVILKRMKRRYDRDELYDRINKARESISDLVLGADVMAGFPTEEEVHFMDTLNAIRDLEIAFPHVFPYSERPGTPAARIPRQVPKPERVARAAKLRQEGVNVLQNKFRQWQGRNVLVLPETADIQTRTACGRLENYLPIRLDNFDGRTGSWVQVKINDHDSDRLHGEISK